MYICICIYINPGYARTNMQYEHGGAMKIHTYIYIYIYTHIRINSMNVEGFQKMCRVLVEDCRYVCMYLCVHVCVVDMPMYICICVANCSCG